MNEHDLTGLMETYFSFSQTPHRPRLIYREQQLTCGHYASDGCSCAQDADIIDLYWSEREQAYSVIEW